MSVSFAVRAILFDLDGTLVDSAPDLCGAMNYLLAMRGHPVLALEQVRDLVGQGGRALLARGLWGEGAIPPQNDPHFEEAVAVFLSYYGNHLTDHSTPYPGVLPMLQWFQQQGVPMAVVTNKPEALAQRMLEQLQLDRFFVHVVGGDTLTTCKPDAEPLLYVLNQLHIPPHQALMVGDSEIDVVAARQAGCPVVLMSHGYRHGMTAQQLSPDGVLDHFDQLRTLCAVLADKKEPS
ncbi:MAG: phosphoglycolate phosphatase [Magnetococcales bacterium]|nr:phosphoglycolate phosphatase [Magnetococcales bacterium]MBF0583429.1 phosphoglycolate phosphatase [Magnetococcales bacterium]